MCGFHLAHLQLRAYGVEVFLCDILNTGGLYGSAGTYNGDEVDALEDMVFQSKVVFV